MNFQLEFKYFICKQFSSVIGKHRFQDFEYNGAFERSTDKALQMYYEILSVKLRSQSPKAPSQNSKYSQKVKQDGQSLTCWATHMPVNNQYNLDKFKHLVIPIIYYKYLWNMILHISEITECTNVLWPIQWLNMKLNYSWFSQMKKESFRRDRLLRHN